MFRNANSFAPLSPVFSFAISTTTDKPTTDPSSPSSPPPPPTAKETLTWEHDRQRLKKNTTFIRSRARKAHPASPVSYDSPKSRKRVASVVSVDRDGDTPDTWEDTRSPVLGAATNTLHERERTSEVPLSDLLISRKPRYSSKSALLLSSSFEFVPPLRSVIVLDDLPAPEFDFDEPWEHVDEDYASASSSSSAGPVTDAGEGEQVLSYAKMVQLN